MLIHVQGRNQSGKTTFVRNFRYFNQAHWLTDIPEVFNPGQYVIDDFDTIFDKRNWMLKENRETLQKLTQNLALAFHNAFDLILITKFGNLNNVLVNQMHVQVTCFQTKNFLEYNILNLSDPALDRQKFSKKRLFVKNNYTDKQIDSRYRKILLWCNNQ